MQSHLRTNLLLPAVLALGGAALLSSCKPAQLDSRVLETGGTAVDWRIKSTVTSSGGLTLEKSGNGAADEAAHIVGAAIEVSSAPDGTVATSSINARQWMPLRSGNSAEDVKFNLLMTTRNLGLCYSNAVQLNGTTDSVTCKDAATAAAGANEAKRAEMQRVCERLSRTQVPDAPATTDVYARFETASAREKCTCLRGKARDLFFGNYYAKTAPATEFENDCKKSVDPTDTTTGTSTATSLAELRTATATATSTTTKTTSGTSTETSTSTKTSTSTGTDTTTATGSSTSTKTTTGSSTGTTTSTSSGAAAEEFEPY